MYWIFYWIEFAIWYQDRKNGQFGTKKANKQQNGQFGTNILKRTIWHQNSEADNLALMKKWNQIIVYLLLKLLTSEANSVSSWSEGPSSAVAWQARWRFHENKKLLFFWILSKLPILDFIPPVSHQESYYKNALEQGGKDVERVERGED